MITLTKNKSTISIDPHGAQVISWRHDSVPVLYEGSERKRSGIPVLFPYYGRPRPDLPQHGFGRDLVWDVVHHDQSSVVLSLDHTKLRPQDIAYYPYRFHTRATVTLTEKALTFSLHVENLSGRDLPICPGLHPYWDISHAAKTSLKIDGIGSYIAAKEHWDTSPPDREYDYVAPVTVTTPTSRFTIADLSAVPVIEKIVLWSQAQSATDHDFVCVEPVCGTRTRYDIDPILVPPDDEWEMRVEFRLD